MSEKFKLESAYNGIAFIKKSSRNFINWDMPNTYYLKDREWILIVDGRYGVLTIDYCVLDVDSQKEILDFLIKSSVSYCKYSYTWKSNTDKTNCLEDDVDNLIRNIYQNTFMDSWREHLSELDYQPMSKKEEELCLAA